MEDGQRSEMQELAFRLSDAIRSLGLETGLDLALTLVYLRWKLESDSEPQQGSFRDIHHPAAVDQLMPAWNRFWVERGSAFAADGGSAFREALYAVDTVAIEGPHEIRPTLHRLFEALLEVRGSRLAKLGFDESTPIGLARLLTGLISPAGREVIDPACGLGNTLLAAAQGGAKRIAGIEINRSLAALTLMRFELAGVSLDLASDDGLVHDESDRFDGVIIQPPWGIKLNQAQLARMREMYPPLERTSSGDAAWLWRAYELLAAGGRAAVLMPAGTLFSKGPLSEIRRDWVESGVLEGVISLPMGALSGSGTRSSILLLQSTEAGYRHRPLLVMDASPMVEQTARRPALKESAIEQIVKGFDDWRAGETPDLPRHVAVAVARNQVLREDSTIVVEAHLEDAPIEKAPRPAPPQRLLTEIRIQNFKSFGRRQRIPLAPLTFLYGPNSAGKSSILQSLLLLKQSIEAEAIVTQGSYTDAGSFLGALHLHDTQRSMEFGLSYGSIEEWGEEGGVPDPSLIRDVDLAFRADGSGVARQEFASTRFGELVVRFSRERKVSDSGSVLTVNVHDLEPVFLGVAEGTLLYPFDARHENGAEDGEERRLRGRQSNARRALRNLLRANVSKLEVRADGLLPSAEVRIPQFGTPGDREQGIVNSYVKRTVQLAAGTAIELRTLLSDLTYLGPLRSAPQRFYNRTAAAVGAGTAGEHVALYLFDNATEVDQVNEWMAKLGLPYEIRVTPVIAHDSTFTVGDLVAVILKDRRSAVDVSPADVGFGVSQVLPIVVELLARQNSVICIEQPEIHLHPALQAEIGDLLIAATSETGQANQVLVETHSEHLLLRVQRRIREGLLDPKNVAVVYVDQDAEGEARVHRLRLDDGGTFLDEWPSGFFEERMNELFGDII